VGTVSSSPLNDGPVLCHQQPRVLCRNIEHLIDLVTTEVNAVDEIGQFPGESHPHD
jgi:hypothetical protein